MVAQQLERKSEKKASYAVYKHVYKLARNENKMIETR